MSENSAEYQSEQTHNILLVLASRDSQQELTMLHAAAREMPEKARGR